MVDTGQFPLDLTYPVSFDLADYIVSASNAEAYRFVENWPATNGHFGAIAGPQGSGKSHLLHGWARDVGAHVLKPQDEISRITAKQLYVIDDVNQRTNKGDFAYSDDFLFHAFNWAKEQNAKILAADVLAPARWPRNLPDLVSRLSTVPVVHINEPDDELLKVLFIKMFSDRQLQVDIEVISYLVSRMPRSFSAAIQLANEMDRMALAERRRITKVLARRCLAEM